jgi:hypothetical protein
MFLIGKSDDERLHGRATLGSGREIKRILKNKVESI